MKNIHVLPTPKPSRLWTNNLRRRLELDEFPEQHPNNIAKNIYITSDEEIKEGDWIKWGEAIYKANKKYIPPFKKIILTTDPDLIAEGVQAIDDEFLQWFVKNPSCERVEIESLNIGDDKLGYVICKPQEEPKPHSFCETPEEKCTLNYCDENGCLNRKRESVEPKQENCCTPVGQIKRYIDCKGCDKKPEQGTLEETLEEAAERIVKNKVGLHYFGNETSLENLAKKEYVIAGAKSDAAREYWFEKFQQEQNKNKYSEEEVLKILLARNVELGIIDKTSEVEEWFNRFKK
jgi:hypothetical protein